MAASGPAALRLRTVTLREGRTTLRLEEAAWSALEQICALRGQTRRAYLQETFDAAEAAAAENRASFLRARLMAELSLRLARAGEAAASDGGDHRIDVRAMLRVCPSPAFVLTPTGRLEAYNDEMALYARRVFPAPPAAGDQLSLRFARPLRVIEQELAAAPGAPALAGFTLTLGRQTSPGQARLVRVGRAEDAERRILGCIQD
jgi:predicted DNA-binding ribbon-helix-helix protein